LRILFRPLAEAPTSLSALLAGSAQEGFRVGPDQGPLDGFVARGEHAISLRTRLLQKIAGAGVVIAATVIEWLVIVPLKETHGGFSPFR
jgi:hypothetical protein